MVREVPDRVAEIAEAFVDKPEPWPQHARAILSGADGKTSRRLIDLHLRLIEKGIIAEARCPFSANNQSFLFFHLPEEQPEWAVDVLEAWLLQRIAAPETVGSPDPFGKDDTSDHLDKMAQGAPEAFAAKILPIVLELARRNAVRIGPPPWSNEIWPYHMYNSHYRLAEQLLDALLVALRLLATEKPDIFAEHAAYLQEYADFKLAGFVLVQAYAANGERFADEATDFLLSNPGWLSLGWTDSSYRASRLLLEAITPHCSEGQLARLEFSILGYYADWEGQDPHRLGAAQLALLNGFAHDRRSHAVRRRIGELQRKFNRSDADPPRGVWGGHVGPPFDASWEHLKDTQWLRAIAKYEGEDTHTGFLKGGANELASRLKEQAKQKPTRFARLLLRFPEDTHPMYFNYVLRGLSEAERIDPELIFQVCRRCHALPGIPCGRFMGNVFESYAECTLPQDILEMVAWYATESPNPEEELWRTLASTGQTYYGGDPESAGLNSIRGGMARAVAHLLFADPQRLDFFRPHLEKMASDPSISVRTQVAHALLPVLNTDRDFAVGQFLKLCDVQEDELLGASSVDKFLYHATDTHSNELKPILERMLHSPYAKAVQAGAHIASLIALSSRNETILLELCSNSSEVIRKAAAEVAAANVASTNNRRACEQALILLFDDEAEDVRGAAADCFREFKGEELRQFPRLIGAFIDSKAFEEEASWFFKALEKTTAMLPDVVCLACERNTELFSKASNEARYTSGRFVSVNHSLLLRLYEQTKSADVKGRCLNIIDSLMKLPNYTLEKALSERER